VPRSDIVEVVSEPDVIRFYWSFRSPYAWLAAHRVERMLAGLPVRLAWIPVYPPPDPAAMPNNPTNVPAKIRYVWEDTQRFADAYGLSFKPPEQVDTDWAKPHTAFLYAEAEGCGPDFVREGFAARFTRGEDLASDQVLSAIALHVGLEPERVISAATDSEFRGRLAKGFESAGRDAIFGVPTFIYRSQMFFGNDRLEWLLKTIGTTLSRAARH
jgi:2-hydroxychromene-2-carboxylate isomerase